MLDRHGQLRHHGGITDAAGLYVLSRPVTRRRSSGLIADISADAADLTDHLTAHLANQPHAA